MPEPLALTVHELPAPALAVDRRTRAGRFKMLLVLAVCAAPVVASYITYFFIRPEGRSNYAELIDPPRAMPAELDALRGQWLLVVVGSGTCDATCEKMLYLQRQLREMTGRDRDRIDKVWLIDDAEPLRPELLAAVDAAPPVTLMRFSADRISRWLQAQHGRSLGEHLFIVDPMGQWMMRAAPDPDPQRLKRDLERLLRASASWDRAGR